eukprot:12898169-Prorocentrum_lima.AAC.1
MITKVARHCFGGCITELGRGSVAILDHLAQILHTDTDTPTAPTAHPPASSATGSASAAPTPLDT